MTTGAVRRFTGLIQSRKPSPAAGGEVPSFRIHHTTVERPGKSILEVILVVGILGVLVGLLLPAVMKVREVATHTKCQNNHRQVILAISNYSLDLGGQLPAYQDGQPTPHMSILPQLEQIGIPTSNSAPSYRFVPSFVCPADPNLFQILDPSSGTGKTSVAMNWQVFGHRSNLFASFGDGTSNTLATAEHYAVCGNMFFLDSAADASFTGYDRAAFAGPNLVRPVTRGNPPVSLGNDRRRPMLTFQVRPQASECMQSVAQTPHPAGMVVTFFDGSVRTLKGAINPTAYWGATTPDRGEVINLD